MAGEGLVSMTPTSIAFSGTSASINADGGVDFSAVTEVSLNGVFTTAYDNYLIVISETLGGAGNAENFVLRLRAAGADASGTDYAWQYVIASSSSVVASRTTSDTSGRVATVSGTSPDANGQTLHMYGPALAGPTSWLSMNVASTDGSIVIDLAATHSVSTAYDGFTLLILVSDITGTVHVFGYEE